MLFFSLVLQCYVVGALVVFTVFLQSFWRDNTTPKNHIGSWKVLGLAAMFWPIVVPFAYLERQLTKSSNKAEMAHNLDVQKWNDTPARAKTDNVIFINRPPKNFSGLDGSVCPIYPHLQSSSPYPIEKKIQG